MLIDQGIYTALDLVPEFLELCRDNKKREGISTGFESLDRLMKLSPGYLSIVSGIPSMGKSEIVDAIAVNMALQSGWKWCFFSPENFPIVEHMAKLAEKYIGKRFDFISRKDKARAAEWIQEHFYWIYPAEDDGLRLASLLAKVAIVKETFGLNGFIFDPWNEITHDNKNMRDDQYLSIALRDLRRFTRAHDLHGIVIAHPNKTEKNTDGTYKPPSLYDLNGGAMWYNKADYGWVAHRHDWGVDEITLYVQKVKFKWMGMKGQVDLHYDVKSGRFKGVHDKEFALPFPGGAQELPY